MPDALTDRILAAWAADDTGDKWMGTIAEHEMREALPLVLVLTREDILMELAAAEALAPDAAPGWGIVTVKCDRCHQQIDGMRTDGLTAGFYEVEHGQGFGKYTNPGERIICDRCMHTDPRYIADYGKAALVTSD